MFCSYSDLYLPARIRGILEPLSILVTGVWLTFSSEQTAALAAREGVWETGASWIAACAASIFGGILLFTRGLLKPSTRQISRHMSPATLSLLNSIMVRPTLCSVARRPSASSLLGPHINRLTSPRFHHAGP